VILRAEGLRVAYGPVVALDGFDLAVDARTSALLGPNGAGKSSFLRSVLGLVPPSAGRIEVLGIDAAEDPLEVRRRVGYMPERDAIIPAANAVAALTYLARVSGLYPRDARRRAHEALDFVGLAEQRYRPLSTLSQGTRQRFRLAAAIVHDPELVFLDEPTNGLDPAGRREMLGLVDKIAELGINVLLCTHLLPDVEATCEEVVVIDRGKVRLAGNIEQLKRMTGTRTFAVRLAGDEPGFRREAAALGLRIGDRGREGLSVTTPDGAGSLLVFRAAAAGGAVVSRLTEVRRSLEEVFLESLRGPSPPGP
ncbi:MAG: ABC transporter ATP-binding protein, partial [Planctomycetota bacterium]